MDLQIASGEIDVMRAQGQSSRTAHGYTGHASHFDNAYARMSREHRNRQLLGRHGMMLKNRTEQTLFSIVEMCWFSCFFP